MTLHVRQYDPAQPITEPGVYQMTEEQYHADPCVKPSVSASLIKVGLPGGRKGGSPLHMKWAHPKLTPKPPEPDAVNKYDMGSTFHSLILGAGAELVIVDAKAWTKNADKEAREEAYKAGKQPVLIGQYQRALAMRDAARHQMHHWPELAEAMKNGVPELVLVWIEDTPSGPVYCRCKLDWIPAEGDFFPDWKSTDGSAAPESYGRIMFDTGADVQDAFYRRGIEKVLHRRCQLIFAAVETAEPHAMMVHAVNNPSFAMAERKVRWGINAFAMCLARGYWPGYPGELAWQDAPPWTETQWTDREDAGITTGEYLSGLIEAMGETKGRSGFDPETAADFGREG